MLRAAGGKPKRTLTAEKLTKQRQTDSFTTAGEKNTELTAAEKRRKLPQTQP